MNSKDFGPSTENNARPSITDKTIYIKEFSVIETVASPRRQGEKF